MAASLPDGRRGQMLAMALSLAVAASVWAGVAAPLVAWHAEQAERLEQRQTLARRMAALAETLPALQAQAAATTKSGRAPNAVLEGNTDAVASAALQQLVQAMATGAGTSLSSVEVLPAEAVGDYRRIGLHVALAAPWPALVHLLQSIELASPPMLVDDLRVHGPPMGTAALPMDASFTVLAFRAGRPP
jgi:general secretion pathway protein M